LSLESKDVFLPPGDPGLSNQELAPYILGRATNDESMVGGLYMRKFPRLKSCRRVRLLEWVGSATRCLVFLWRVWWSRADPSGTAGIRPYTEVCCCRKPWVAGSEGPDL